MPSTFRPSFRIPAILLKDPFGFASVHDSRLGRRRISKRDSILAFKTLQLFWSAEIVAFHVPNRNLEHLALW